MDRSLRLIEGRDGWWALAGRSAARLPRQAVASSGDVLSGLGRGVDGERGLALSADAISALDSGGFFATAANDNYAVTVLTATACNLGCNYCFQNTALAPTGSYAPPRIATAVLDDEMVEATVAFVHRQLLASDLKSTNLLLFGGEPLLNVSGCLRLLRGLTPLNLVDAEVVTNGVLLTPSVTDALTTAGLRRVQITFDGDRRSHDRVRVTRNGRPTYDRILENVALSSASAPRLSWNLRVNVSHHNVEGLYSLLEDLASVIQDARQITLHLALIDDNGLGYENTVGYDEKLADTFIELHRVAILSGMGVPPSNSLRACPYCSTVGGSRGAVINADGGLYSCWENAGRDGWAIGNVRTGYTASPLLQERWVACDFDIKPHASAEATRRFLDRVDAAALDEQADQGRLHQKVLAKGAVR